MSRERSATSRSISKQDMLAHGLATKSESKSMRQIEAMIGSALTDGDLDAVRAGHSKSARHLGKIL